MSRSAASNESQTEARRISCVNAAKDEGVSIAKLDWLGYSQGPIDLKPLPLKKDTSGCR
jgi:hypothetical protein